MLASLLFLWAGTLIDFGLVPLPSHYRYECLVVNYDFRFYWLLYLPIDSAFNNSTFCLHRIFIGFVWISEQTAIISVYSINWTVCITETESVYSVVRAGSLYVILYQHV